MHESYHHAIIHAFIHTRGQIVGLVFSLDSSSARTQYTRRKSDREMNCYSRPQSILPLKCFSPPHSGTRSHHHLTYFLILNGKYLLRLLPRISSIFSFRYIYKPYHKRRLSPCLKKVLMMMGWAGAGTGKEQGWSRSRARKGVLRPSASVHVIPYYAYNVATRRRRSDPMGEPEF